MLNSALRFELHGVALVRDPGVIFSGLFIE
jgi:hypothetical protein